MAYPYKKQKLFSDEPKKKTLHTKVLTDAQAEKLEAWLDKHLWAPYKVDYAKFAYKSRDVNVVVYTSGKLVVQGKGTEDFVAFVWSLKLAERSKWGMTRFCIPNGTSFTPE